MGTETVKRTALCPPQVVSMPMPEVGVGDCQALACWGPGEMVSDIWPGRAVTRVHAGRQSQTNDRLCHRHKGKLRLPSDGSLVTQPERGTAESLEQPVCPPTLQQRVPWDADPLLPDPVLLLLPRMHRAPLSLPLHPRCYKPRAASL